MNKLTVLILFLGYAFGAFGQGVGIGTNAPDSSAVIDISSVTQGMLMPRMTTAQRDAIVSPAAGLVILNIDDYCLDIFDGTYWSKNCGLRITGADTVPDEWISTTPFGGLARDGAISFVIAGKAYVGSGKSYGYYRDLWEFSPASNSWVQKADHPGLARSSAVGFSALGKGYLATGYGEGSNVLNDVIEYDPLGNTWTFKSDFPGAPRGASVVVERPGHMDVLLIGGLPGSDETWKYLPSSDEWVPLGNFPVSIFGAVGFLLDSIVMVGTGNTGVSETNHFYTYNDALDQWSFHSSMSGAARSGAVAMVIGQSAYVGTGYNTINGSTYLADFWKYNSTTGWIPAPSLPIGTRARAVSFAINGKGYLATGSSDAFPYYYEDTWALEPAHSQGYIYESPLPPPDAFSYSDGIWSRDSTDNIFSDDQSNVGIGTASPDAKLHVNGSLKVSGDVQSPLKFGNIPAPRKVVLLANGDNDHEFYGFGVFGSILRYQSTGDHVFNWGQNSTTSHERMRLKADGRLGIGTGAPEAAVDISRGFAPATLSARGSDYSSLFNYDIYEDTYIRGGKEGSNVFINDYHDLGNVGIGQSTANNKLDIQAGFTRTGAHASYRPLYVTGALEESSNGIEFRHYNGTQGIGFGFSTIYATGSNTNQDLGLASRGTGILKFSTNGAERLRITGTGNVGIGTTTPNAPLQLGNELANRKVVLWEGQNNDHVFYGFGVNGSTLRYQVSNPSDNHVFYAGTSATTSQELMRIKGNGNVTITGIIENEGYAAPSFLNGFTNYGNGYVAAGYYKDKEGIVRLRGTVTKNSSPNGQAIFVLPAGYRPSSGTVAFSVVNNGTLGVVEILWDGAVFVQNCAAGWISLDSIVFRAD